MKTAFTIATANYLAQAKTVADSLLAHNPAFTFFIVLLDKKQELDTSCFGNITLIEIDHIGIPCLDEMVDRYSIFELSNALKSFCAEYFLNRIDCEAVMYFDSDIMVCNTLTEINDALKYYNIILTPHMLHPPPYDGMRLNESDFLNAGIFNGGFFALARSEDATQFLAWWKERMRTQCFVDFTKGLFVDQIWLNFVPVYFNKVKMLDLPGYNVAYWNLHERNIALINGVYMVNNSSPLAFFHFSGYDFNKPEVMSKFQTRYTFDQRKDVVPLFTDYHESLIRNHYQKFSALPCYYAQQKQQHAAQVQPVTRAGHKSLAALFRRAITKVLTMR